MAAINPGWPNHAEPFLEGLSSSFFGPRQEQRPLGRGTKKVTDSELAGEWAETEVLVKCRGHTRRPVRFPGRRVSEFRTLSMRELGKPSS